MSVPCPKCGFGFSRGQLLWFAALGLTFMVASCGEDSGTEPDGRLWRVGYKAINESDSDLIVGLSGPATSGATSVEYSVAARGEAELLSYEAALDSHPAVEDDFWCVSIRLEGDRTLVRQLCPVSSDQWEIGEPAGHQTEFWLTIREADLDPIEERCPRLSGLVFESETGNAIPGATVSYLGVGRFSVATSSNGRYLFYLPGGPLQGVVTVSGQGHRAVEYVLPGDIVGFSNGIYRLDFGLMISGE